MNVNRLNTKWIVNKYYIAPSVVESLYIIWGGGELSNSLKMGREGGVKLTTNTTIFLNRMLRLYLYL